MRCPRRRSTPAAWHSASSIMTIARAEPSQNSWPRVFSWNCDVVLLHQRNEVARLVAAQCRSAEMRIVGEEPLRHRFDIGEVAAPAAGDQDLRARLRGMVEQQHAPTAPPGADRAHQAGRAGAEDDHVIGCHGTGAGDPLSLRAGSDGAQRSDDAGAGIVRNAGGVAGDRRRHRVHARVDLIRTGAGAQPYASGASVVKFTIRLGPASAVWTEPVICAALHAATGLRPLGRTPDPRRPGPGMPAGHRQR